MNRAISSLVEHGVGVDGEPYQMELQPLQAPFCVIPAFDRMVRGRSTVEGLLLP